MRLGDLDGVMLIEEVSYNSPWSRNAFVREISDNTTADYIVAEIPDVGVVGYCGMWLLLDEAHVTNVAVHPEYRRRGIATALLQVAARRAVARGVARLTLEVRPGNAGAKDLYSRLGFAARGRRKHYYSDTGEDAIIMWLDDARQLAGVKGDQAP
jgi:ribosomal-protein-alanine N-acetyltransferase